MSIAWDGGGAKKGATYGSVIPGFGTALGGVLGGVFGGGKGGPSVPKNPRGGIFDDEYIAYLKGVLGGGPNHRYGGQEVDLATLQSFKSIFGRDPTATEFTLYGPMGAQGRQAMAEAKLAEDNSPEKIYARQQEEYKKKAPENYGTVDRLFTQFLNHTATQEEKDHFGALLASGQYDAYSLGEALKQLPEAVRKEDEAFRASLGTELAAADQEYFQKNILPSIQKQFATQGRSMDSSSFAAAATNSAQAQNVDRQKYIAGISADQYAGRQGNARADYEGYLNNYYGLQNAGINSQMQAQNALFGRANEISDYNTHKRTYDNYLSRYGKRQSISGQDIGTLAGLGMRAWLATRGSGNEWLGTNLGRGGGSADDSFM